MLCFGGSRKMRSNGLWYVSVTQIDASNGRLIKLEVMEQVKVEDSPSIEGPLLDEESSSVRRRQQDSLLDQPSKPSGFRFPIHAIILNLLIAVPLAFFLLVLLIHATEVTLRMAGKENRSRDQLKQDYGIEGMLFCPPFIEGTLATELSAQVIYIIGSILLLLGALKNHRNCCHAYLAMTLLSFGISFSNKIGQYYLCEYDPFKPTDHFAPRFNLVCMFVPCQIIWYLIMFCFVARMLKWFPSFQLKDEEAAHTKSTEKFSSVGVTHNVPSSSRQTRKGICFGIL